MMSKAAEKKRAALHAVSFVQSGMTLGLGTGSTAKFAVEAIGEKWQAGELRGLRAVPTSDATAALAAGYGIPLLALSDVEEIDLTIDGADEFDPQLRLIKGGGGAHLREKLVAFASKELYIITDASKQVEQLGKFPLPLEVIPSALSLVKKTLTDQGVTTRQRMQNDGTPFITDYGNFILDAQMDRIDDPMVLDITLHAIPGLIETGLFLGLTTKIILAKAEEIVTFSV